MLILLHLPPKTRTENPHACSISGEYAEYLNEALPLLELKEYLEKRDHLGPCSGFEKCQVSLLRLEFAAMVRFFSRANLFNLIKIM